MRYLSNLILDDITYVEISHKKMVKVEKSKKINLSTLMLLIAPFKVEFDNSL